MERTNYKYCYNINCANFFMRQGIVCRGTGVNKKTGKTFWAFNYDECQEAYIKWNEYKDSKSE